MPAAHFAPFLSPGPEERWPEGPEWGCFKITEP